MLKAKYGASACLLGHEYIYIVGGFNNGALNDIEKYDIEKNSWEVIQLVSDL